ncbi:MAG: O-antigen ligase family protein [Chlorobi bacterium]|nr:O-antigen ligase family protein [Chlorobiota bacterium]
MADKAKIIWVYALSALFLAVNFYLVLEKDFYWLFLLPLVLIVVYYYLVSLDKIILLITFLTPLSVNIRDMEMGLGVALPTEPLMFGVVLIFIANLIFENKYDRNIARHPISYIIYFDLLWMLLTTFTSELPVVSLKHLLSQIWFVVPFYFVISLMFKDKKKIRNFFWLYLIPLVAVVIYTITQHAKYGFEEEAGHWVMSPFYNDHTAYGAALAIFYPVVIGLIFYPGSSKFSRFSAFVITIIMTFAIILSYSRAAWISIAAAFVVFVLVMFKIRFYWVALATAVIIGAFVIFQQQIFDVLEKNKQDSSANFVEHVRSIANISSDASNLERINRWQAALRMAEERPVLGWGGGTYQFLYAPFQLAKEKTIISTNLGDKGNAHSEYLGPLAEMGIPGLLIVLILVIVVLYKGLMVYRHSEREEKFLSLMVTLGLVTYFVHGFLNNFLDTDKLSVPFWGFIAVIVALDVYHTGKPDEAAGENISN